MEPLVPDDHDRDEDASYAEFRFSFFENENEKDEDGKPTPTLSNIESHMHRVNEHTLVDALLVVARQFVARHMEEHMFSDNVPQEVRSVASNMLAQNWLISRLQSGDLTMAQPIEFEVPDDLSELLGD